MWQPVLMIDGFILCILGISMIIPAGLDMIDEKMSWSPFLSSALVTIFIGMSLFLANKGKITKISLRQGYLITFFCWLTVALFSSIPFILGNVTSDISSAFFESVSGVTATGASVIADVESLSRSMLLWRSMLNGLGGIGVVIFAVAMLPFLGIGGMQMFEHESSDTNEKLMPKFIDVAKWIIGVYIGLVILCALALYFCGMSRFDAINHALSTVSTAGFSTKNNSIAYYDSISIETVLMFFMILGSLPITFYIILLQHHEMEPLRLGQIKTFLKSVVILTFLVALYLCFHNHVGFFKALRYASFNVVSVTTTTGMTSTDYVQWGAWTAVFFTLLSLHGGCIGSTTGSIKVMRWQVMKSYFSKFLLSSIEPNRVIPVKIDKTPIPDNAVISVFVYIMSFLMIIGGVALVLNLQGYDFTIALAASVSCVTNTGPGAIAEIGASGNYAFFSDFAKYTLCAAMLLGRLEIMTVLVIFTKSFWKN